MKASELTTKNPPVSHGAIMSKHSNPSLLAALLKQGTVSMEDEEGIKQEKEYILFYKLTDLTQLFSAQLVLEQEQWEIKLEAQEGAKKQGFLRVRRTTEKNKDSSSNYMLTLKVAEEGVTGRKEGNREIDADFFELYKSVAVKGMLKTRFHFPIPGTEGTWPTEPDCPAPQFGGALVWEVDVFKAPDGKGFYPWVKVDLEVPSALSELPPFPLSYAKSITAQYADRNEDEKAFIKELFDKVFSSVNAAEVDDAQISN